MQSASITLLCIFLYFYSITSGWFPGTHANLLPIAIFVPFGNGTGGSWKRCSAQYGRHATSGRVTKTVSSRYDPSTSKPAAQLENMMC